MSFLKVKYWSIKRILIVITIILVLSPSLAIGIITYSNSEDIVEDSVKEIADETLSSFDSQVSMTINNLVSTIDYYSDIFNEESFKDKDAINEQLTAMAKSNKDIESIYLTDTKTNDLIIYPSIKLDKDFDITSRDWHKGATRNRGKVFISDVYLGANGKQNLTLSKTLDDNSGIVGIDIDVSTLINNVEETTVGSTGFITILGLDRLVLADKELTVGEESQYNKEDLDIIYNDNEGIILLTTEDNDYSVKYITNEATGWKIVSNINLKDFDNALKPISSATIRVVILSVLFSAFLSIIIVRLLLKPLDTITQKLNLVSQGDLTEKIDIKNNNRNEFNILSKSINHMIDSIQGIVKKVEDNASYVSNSSQIVNASVEENNNALSEVTNAIQDMATYTDNQNNDVEQNAELIEEISDGLEQISHSIQSVADYSNDTNNLVQEGSKVVSETNAQMNTIYEKVNLAGTRTGVLSDKVKDIETIVSIINAISDQTKLLALNASIEAARAGDAGRGFAVVANEVRNLAEQSTESIKQIEEIVNEILSETKIVVDSVEDGKNSVEEGIKQTDSTNKIFKDISTSVENISVQTQEISAATEEITASVSNVLDNTNHIKYLSSNLANDVQNIASTSEEQKSSMDEISLSTEQLEKVSNELKVILSVFKL